MTAADPAAPAERRGMDDALARGLAQAQAAVRSALKTSKNDHHGYMYASAEDVLIVARDALSAGGLAWALRSARFVLWPAQPGDGKQGGVWGAVGHLELRVAIVATGTGAELEIATEIPVVPQQGRPLDKALFGARTEGLSYLLRDLLLIPREQSPDVSGRADTIERARPRTEPTRRSTEETIAEIDKAEEIARVVAIVQAQRQGAGGAMSEEDGERIEEAFTRRVVALLAALSPLAKVTQAAALLKRLRPSGERAAAVAAAISEARSRNGGTP